MSTNHFFHRLNDVFNADLKSHLEKVTCRGSLESSEEYCNTISSLQEYMNISTEDKDNSYIYYNSEDEDEISSLVNGQYWALNSNCHEISEYMDEYEYKYEYGEYALRFENKCKDIVLYEKNNEICKLHLPDYFSKVTDVIPHETFPLKSDCGIYVYFDYLNLPKVSNEPWSYAVLLNIRLPH